MPLVDLSAEIAVSNRKSNPFASWGDRNQANRVEPIAKPSFDVPFQLEPGEPIFTVGSCFARNVETELLKRGFSLPMRDIFARPEFQGMELGAINNFGTPSIFNEFAWAFGERAFDEADHIIEVQAGKFADLHLIPSIRPEARDDVVARRRAITQAFRTVAECRVLIMTLGLVEVWFDTRTGYYLNATPRPSLIRAEPDRFRLHVLSFEDCYRYLDDALAIVRKHGRDDLQVLLTVSPVPLMATHRMQDVMVANTYSKSVLRAVAESIVAAHPFVTYYPSYESVVLSDRRHAWGDDMIHVTDEIVALNVGRMIDAFAATDYDAAAVAAEIAAGGASVAVEKAQKMRRGSRDVAATFFDDNAGLSAIWTDFALEHGGFLIDTERFAEALRVLEAAPGGADDDRITLSVSEALIALGRFSEAFARLDPVAQAESKSYVVWKLLLEAALGSDDEALVSGVLARWARVSPGRASRANATVGRWYQERGQLDRAMGYLETAAALDVDDATPRLYLAQIYIGLGRRDDARAVMEGVKATTPTQIKLASRLQSLVY